MRFAMKSASIPSLRVDPELRAAAESVLKDGETLSAFVEQAVKAQINYRQTQAEFIARGLASLEEAKQTGIYYSSEEVLAGLKAKLDQKRTENRSR
jgi:predicted transcriptional regulator